MTLIVKHTSGQKFFVETGTVYTVGDLKQVIEAKSEMKYLKEDQTMVLHDEKLDDETRLFMLIVAEGRHVLLVCKPSDSEDRPRKKPKTNAAEMPAEEESAEEINIEVDLNAETTNRNIRRFNEIYNFFVKGNDPPTCGNISIDNCLKWFHKANILNIGQLNIVSIVKEFKRVSGNESCMSMDQYNTLIKEIGNTINICDKVLFLLLESIQCETEEEKRLYLHV